MSDRNKSTGIRSKTTANSQSVNTQHKESLQSKAMSPQGLLLPKEIARTSESPKKHVSQQRQLHEALPKKASPAPASFKQPLESPTKIAEERISKQLQFLRAKLTALRPKENQQLNVAFARFREEWIDERLNQHPIESLEVQRIGAQIINDLRQSGIKTIAELKNLTSRRIPGIGDARAQSLILEYEKHRSQALEDFRDLSGVHVDSLSRGELGDHVREGRQQNTEMMREVQALRIRINELEQRLVDIKNGSTACGP